ncbi:class I SAM-dependent methyltransferase [Occallatibacter riparius]|uniref:Class I SAM-dependent methyltransferase n=1 Tax=Occallatibacter riparius TaxID=1002689 RepID=A0A9J7BRU4_9BACT|nr:class I SAM-dependent methyltransferase [Occallatibacter riparius]UWZ85384.1 class I SAM-dependent methyltransferase [Occallatibacter riparius]
MATKGHHGHMLWVGVLGFLAGAAFLFYAPSLKAVSSTLFLFAGFHVAGAAIMFASAYVIGADKLLARFTPRRRNHTFNFGWAPAWTLGPIIAAAILFAAAILIEIAATHYWPAALIFTLLAACFFVGGIFARSVTRVDDAVLPMVALTPVGVENPIILDAGCGSGRTTIALARALTQGTIVALDRFDAGYIEGGGRTLIEQNLRLAGLRDRVRITPGDITRLGLPDATFDAAVSAHAMDHLGRSTAQGLREIHRVLKPGARFLLIVWVPGWTMFTIANVLSFFLASPRVWRRRVAEAGFRLADEGRFNGYWFAVLERPD